MKMSSMKRKLRWMKITSYWKADSPSDADVEIPGLTTRQRALKSRDGNGESLIEFPDGLLTTSSRSKFIVYITVF
jgi:hypothetical protein